MSCLNKHWPLLMMFSLALLCLTACTDGRVKRVETVGSFRFAYIEHPGGWLTHASVDTVEISHGLFRRQARWAGDDNSWLNDVGYVNEVQRLPSKEAAWLVSVRGADETFTGILRERDGASIQMVASGRNGSGFMIPVDHARWYIPGRGWHGAPPDRAFEADRVFNAETLAQHPLPFRQPEMDGVSAFDRIGIVSLSPDEEAGVWLFQSNTEQPDNPIPWFAIVSSRGIQRMNLSPAWLKEHHFPPLGAPDFKPPDEWFQHYFRWAKKPDGSWLVCRMNAVNNNKQDAVPVCAPNSPGVSGS